MLDNEMQRSILLTREVVVKVMHFQETKSNDVKINSPYDDLGLIRRRVTHTHTPYRRRQRMM